MANRSEQDNRVLKIILLFITISLFLVIFIISIFTTIKSERKIPTLDIQRKELATRGEIYSKDSFKISGSKKIFKASIDTRYLDIYKKDLFVKLFSIYSGISYEKILKKVEDSLKKPGNLVLSYNIDSRAAKNLKELSFKLRKLKVFIPINDRLRALDINVSGEKRVFSYEDTLTPVIGYISKYETKDGKTRVKGIKGLEKSFNDVLNNSKDGILSGSRDVLSYISFNKKSKMKQRVNGSNLYLNIPLKLQKNIEFILDEYKQKLKAKEIIASIMHSKTGRILSLSSSNRFNPSNILREDIPSLNVKAVEYPFEPGSVIKPISISLVLDKKRVKRDKLFFAYNKGKINSKGEYPKGRFKLDWHYIHDDHKFKKNYLSIDDIVIYSSNIGTLQLAQYLSGKEFLDGFHRYGFQRKTNIELPYEKIGVLPSLNKLSAGESKNKDNVYKATVSYGQGMTSTFMQVLKAYSVFNNDGYIVSPTLVSKINETKVTYKKNEKVISKETAEEIKRLLIKTVKEGTGKAAFIKGLEIGGKTGTAQIARGGIYQKEYISSFFGFANDKIDSYTIAVTVFNPNSKGKYWFQRYASHSAVPVFKEIVQTLVKQDYLKKNN